MGPSAKDGYLYFWDSWGMDFNQAYQPNDSKTSPDAHQPSSGSLSTGDGASEDSPELLRMLRGELPHLTDKHKWQDSAVRPHHVGVAPEGIATVCGLGVMTVQSI
jgi:hypothetical protein